MGIAKETDTHPANMAENKNTIKNIAKKFKKIFNKKEKHEKEIEKPKEPLKPETKTEPSKCNINADALFENFKKLGIQDAAVKETEKDDDEFKYFTFKTVEDAKRSERTDSQSSQDSGFSEKLTPTDEVLINTRSKEINIDIKIEKATDRTPAERTDHKTDSNEKNTKEIVIIKEVKDEAKGNSSDICDSFKGLKIDEGKRKTVVRSIRRGPIRHKDEDRGQFAQPYWISQTNRDHLTGCQVTIDPARHVLEEALSNFGQREMSLLDRNDVFELINNEYMNPSPNFPTQPSRPTLPSTNDINDVASLDIPEFLKIISQINSNQIVNDLQDTIENDLLHDFDIVPVDEDNITIQNRITEAPKVTMIDINEHEAYEHLSSYPIPSFPLEEEQNTFPTPPRSEVLSPLSDSFSYCPMNSLSSTTLSPNSDLERFQEIEANSPDIPSCVIEPCEKQVKKKGRSSSMSLTDYKKTMKVLRDEYAKKECCRIKRKSCKEIFQTHFLALEPEMRKKMLWKVSKINDKEAEWLLHKIIQSLSKTKSCDDAQYALFGIVCEMILNKNPSKFLNDSGLTLLDMAVLFCPRHPLLTRYLVQCVRLALKLDTTFVEGKTSVFNKVDDRNETLLLACVRGGDEFAAVLTELVLVEGRDKPLFDVSHANAEGHSALHVACQQHTAATPSAHLVHVLLHHTGADIATPAKTGDDTPLHLAVHSPNCDFNLVLLIFSHFERAQWHVLARMKNRSGTTPLDIARCSHKTAAKPNYPAEVSDFLKRCRNNDANKKTN